MSARNPSGLLADSRRCPLYPTRPDPTRPVSTYVAAHGTYVFGHPWNSPNPKSSLTQRASRSTSRIRGIFA